MNRINKCPHCGADLQENALFCPFCMQVLKDKKNMSDKPKNRTHWIIVASTAVVLIAAVITWVLWPKPPVEKTHVHTWEPVTETIHHEAVGYLDLIVVGYEDVVHHYCYYEPDKYLAIFSMDGMREHMIRNHKHEPDYEQVMNNLEAYTKTEEAEMPIYDYSPRDVPAYDETIVTGYKCSGCGKTREADDPPK